MSTVAKIAADQALAFLIGLIFVLIIQPTTPGGTLLLILIALAVVNVIAQFVRFLFGKKRTDSAMES
jgi:hypothetical protein